MTWMILFVGFLVSMFLYIPKNFIYPDIHNIKNNITHCFYSFVVIMMLLSLF